MVSATTVEVVPKVVEAVPVKKNFERCRGTPGKSVQGKRRKAFSP